MERKVVVLGTGGTIAGTSDMAGANVGYTAGQIGVEQLLSAIPALARAAGASLVAEQIAQIDSKDMGFEVWARLAQRCALHMARTRWKRRPGCWRTCWMPPGPWC